MRTALEKPLQAWTSRSRTSGGGGLGLVPGCTGTERDQCEQGGASSKKVGDCGQRRRISCEWQAGLSSCCLPMSGRD